MKVAEIKNCLNCEKQTLWKIENDLMKCSMCHKDNLNNLKSDVFGFVPFEPYYDRVLRTWVTSSHDQIRKMERHRSQSHPEGLIPVNEDKKFLKECKDIRNNRLDYLRKTYGDNYVKHQMETNPVFKNKVTRSNRTSFSFSR